MQRIIYFLIRNKDFILFLSFLTISLSININYNEYNKSKFFNSSNSLFSSLYNTKLTISKYFNLEYQNQLLAEENRNLRFMIYNSRNDQIEESDLDKINFNVTSASVIKNSYSYSNNFITINVGERDSIEIDNGVISSLGVVGIIDKISPNYSRFISILNTNKGPIIEFSINFLTNNSSKFFRKFGLYDFEKEETILFLDGSIDVNKKKMNLKKIVKDSRERVSSKETSLIENSFNQLILNEGIEGMFDFIKFKKFLQENY